MESFEAVGCRWETYRMDDRNSIYDCTYRVRNTTTGAQYHFEFLSDAENFISLLKAAK